jgi:hypothetical protein
LAWLAWGAFFLWWGLVDSDFGVLRELPRGMGWLGVGLILLGLNAARWRSGFSIGRLSLLLGLLATALGLAKLAGLWPSAGVEVSFLAAALIVAGLAILSSRLEPC